MILCELRVNPEGKKEGYIESAIALSDEVITRMLVDSDPAGA